MGGRLHDRCYWQRHFNRLVTVTLGGSVTTLTSTPHTAFAQALASSRASGTALRRLRRFLNGKNSKQTPLSQRLICFSGCAQCCVLRERVSVTI